jgi:hypothetical protein
MQPYEQLGLFYLGKRYDMTARRRTDESVLYDSRDLVNHPVCVGMTGSGKTGLGVTAIEEAALDGIPALAIDPKATSRISFSLSRPHTPGIRAVGTSVRCGDTWDDCREPRRRTSEHVARGSRRMAAGQFTYRTATRRCRGQRQPTSREKLPRWLPNGRSNLSRRWRSNRSERRSVCACSRCCGYRQRCDFVRRSSASRRFSARMVRMMSTLTAINASSSPPR